MNMLNLAKKLEGIHTIDTMAETLGIKISTAIKLVSKLRKEGYLKNSGGGKQVRFYKITPEKNVEIGNPGLYDIINKYSRIKIVSSHVNRIMNKKLTTEEALIRAVKTNDIRIIIASLELFNHIKNWSLLSKLAEQEGLGRKIGALYDAARTIIKVRRMDRRIRNKLLKSKVKNRYIISQIKSKDMGEIEKIWNVYLPFNKADLMRYKE